ncbi:MAG: hypothetical protein MRY64_01595 [Hyphomonadaceae bacterium]|nr:hypothetical protein [Hyphomonadaceae bacterium]
MNSVRIASLCLALFSGHALAQDAAGSRTLENDGAFALISVSDADYRQMRAEYEKAQESGSYEYLLEHAVPLEDEFLSWAQAIVAMGMGMRTPSADQYLALRCASFSVAQIRISGTTPELSSDAELFIRHALHRSDYANEARDAASQARMDGDIELAEDFEVEIANMLDANELYVVHNLNARSLAEVQISFPQEQIDLMTAHCADERQTIERYLSLNNIHYE